MIEWFNNLFKKPEPIGNSESPLDLSESAYCKRLNRVLQGVLEYRLPDGTRVDILTDCVAFEVDFAPKFYEAIGQATHYSRITGKMPGIILLVKNSDHEKYVIRCSKAIKDLRIGDKQFVLLIYRDYEG